MLKLDEKNRKWWVLLAMTSCISTIFLDQTILPVCLPTIQRDLNISANQLQWIINAYLLALTALLIGGGRIGDLFGHRKIFCLGLVVFAGASALCGLSFSGWWFIASRSLQGVGGALLMPATAAILLNIFPQNQRGKALGIYTSVGSLFLSIGPTLGGFFTEFLSWRYSFWINIPIAIFGMTLALLFVPRSEKRKDVFDVFGFLTLAAGIVCLVLGLMQGKVWGWTSPLNLTFIVIGLGLILLFFNADRYQERPLVDFSLFKHRNYLVGMLCISLTAFLLMSTVFWTIYFQNILNYSPAEAGLLALLSNIPIIFMAPLGGYLVDRFGPKIPIVMGFSLATFSLVWFILFNKAPGLASLLPILIPFGCGIPLIFTPSFVSMMDEIPPHQRGSASAFNNTMRQFASTLGMAVIGALFISVQQDGFTSSLLSNPSTEQLDAGQFEGLLSKNPVALQALARLGPQIGMIVQQNFRDAFIRAFAYANALSGIVSFLGIFIALFFLKNRLKHEIE